MPYGLTSSRDRATHPVEDLLFLGLGMFAIFTFAYDLALLLPLSLRTVSLIALGAAALPALVFFRLTRRFTIDLAQYFGERLRNTEGMLLAVMSLAAGLVALLANRPDPTDAIYLARAVASWEGWRAPMPASGALPLGVAPVGKFWNLPAWEHFAAAIAGLTWLHPLTVHHLVLPALAGTAVPLAWHAALARVSHTGRAALAGTLALVLLMLLDATSVRSIGNLGLLRIWQGKVILLAVLAPLAMAVAIDVQRHGRPGDWMRLLVLGVAGIGLSTAAAFFLPLLVGVAGATYWIAYLPPARPWRVPLAALAVFAYPAVAVLPFYPGLAAPGPDLMTTVAADLRDVLALVYGRLTAPLVMAALVGTVGLVLARRGRLLGWFTLWAAVLALPLAIPASADLLVARFISAEALWRVAYLGPVLLMTGAGFGSLADVRYCRPVLLFLLVGMAAATVGLAVRGAEPSPFADPAMRFPSLAVKVAPARLAEARAVLEALPPGSLLAPAELSVTLPLLSGRQRLLVIAAYDAPPDAGGSDLARAQAWIDGTGRDAAAARRAIAAERPDAIILPPAMAELEATEAWLGEIGFRPLAYGGRYRLFVRAG